MSTNDDINNQNIAINYRSQANCNNSRNIVQFIFVLFYFVLYTSLTHTHTEPTHRAMELATHAEICQILVIRSTNASCLFTGQLDLIRNIYYNIPLNCVSLSNNGDENAFFYII